MTQVFRCNVATSNPFILFEGRRCCFERTAVFLYSILRRAKNCIVPKTASVTLPLKVLQCGLVDTALVTVCLSGKRLLYV